MPPKLIGPYRVLATLGSGGTGTVYRAIDRRTNEELALKLLSTGPALDPKAALRLAREFETLRDLSHPNVVRVFDTGVFQGYPYLAMELVEGLTLRHYLTLTGEDLYTYASTGSASDVAIPATEESASMSVSRTGIKPFTLSAFHEEPMSEEELSYGQGPDRLRELAEEISEPDTVSLDEESHPGHGPPPVVLTKERQKTLEALDSLNRPERMGRLKDAMLQLCEALAYVHGHGLVHRDLKPSNIMVDEDRLVRLMDFGLAKYLAEDSGVTAHGRLVGTFRYMSPEQILGEPLDARSDLYALGVMLYELLAGRAPFDAQNPQELWQKVLETEPPGILTLNPKTDTQLARVAHKLIRKEPDQRYQTAEEVYEALAE